MRFILGLLLLICGLSVHASDSLSTDKKMPNAFTVNLVRDNFYGFFTYAVGSYGVSKNKSITAFALLRAVQFGAGVTFLTLKSRLLVTPVLSVSNGQSLSGSSRVLLGESFCPGVVSTYNSKKLFIDQGALYYKVVRKKGPVYFDALLYWFSVAYKVNSKVQVGLYNESTMQTKISEGKRQVYYMWIGPYVQWNVMDNAYFKVTGGYDFKEGDYVRATIGFNINQ